MSWKPAVLALIMVGTLAACETTEGFGRDVSTAGHVLQREANEAKYGY